MYAEAFIEEHRKKYTFVSIDDVKFNLVKMFTRDDMFSGLMGASDAASPGCNLDSNAVPLIRALP